MVPPGSRILFETKHYRAAVATAGYVSGVVGGSFVDIKTGAHDLGFGLGIVDFLLELAKVTDKKVSREELFKEDEAATE